MQIDSSGDNLHEMSNPTSGKNKKNIINLLSVEFNHTCIGLDKSGYQVNIFLISPQKHMLWVFIRSASARRF